MRVKFFARPENVCLAALILSKDLSGLATVPVGEFSFPDKVMSKLISKYVDSPRRALWLHIKFHVAKS